MIRGLVAGFGETLTHELPALRELGVELIRTDTQKQTPETTAARVQEITDAGLAPLAVVRTVEQLALLPAGTNVELRNEPDLEGPKAGAYETLVNAFAPECDRLGLHLWAGVVSNLNERGIRYLTDAHADRWPENVGVSVHRYPDGDSPHNPHKGFSSREQEVETLRRVISGAQRTERLWGLTEFGYHSAGRKSGLFGGKKQWTDIQVAEHVAWEFGFWQRMGSVWAVLYQLNDGPTDTPIDRYGIRTVSGTWKPVAQTFEGGS